MVLTSAPSSLPTKSQFLRPTAWRRRFSSEMLLWRGRSAVVEETLERDPLIAGVADAVCDRRLVEHAVGFGVAPGEEARRWRADCSWRARRFLLPR